jgi:hypothetical protein
VNCPKPCTGAVVPPSTLSAALAASEWRRTAGGRSYV